MTSLWYVLPPISPSTLIPAPVVIVRILQYLHTYTRSFSPFNHAPVLIVIRVSCVWQTPRAESPSKRQLEENHGGAKPLMHDTCHVLKCAGDESGKEVTDFCMDSFFLCFILSRPSSVELIMEHRKWQVRDSLGVWASVCPILSQGSECQRASASAGRAPFPCHFTPNYKQGPCGQFGKLYITGMVMVIFWRLTTWDTTRREKNI